MENVNSGTYTQKLEVQWIIKPHRRLSSKCTCTDLHNGHLISHVTMSCDYIKNVYYHTTNWLTIIWVTRHEIVKKSTSSQT